MDVIALFKSIFPLILLISASTAQVAIQWKNRLRSTDDYCLELTTSNNGKIQMNTCQVITIQTMIYYNFQADNTLRSYGNNVCLEASPDTNGVVLSNCSPKLSKFQWQRDSEERFISMANPGLCLDLAETNGADNVGLVMRPCSSSLSQKWYQNNCTVDLSLNPPKVGCQCDLDIPECRGSLMLKMFDGNPEDLCITKEKNSTFLITDICSNSTDQQFTHDNSERLVISSTGQCVTHNLTNNASVFLAPCTNSLLQRWRWTTNQRYRTYDQPIYYLTSTDNSIGSRIVTSLKYTEQQSLQRFDHPFCGKGQILNSTFGCVACPIGTVKQTNGIYPCELCPIDQIPTPTRKICQPYERDYGVIVLAGNASIGNADGYGTNAVLNYPHGLLVGENDTVYFTEYYGYRVKKISSDGFVSTIAGNDKKTIFDGKGTRASFAFPVSLIFCPNNTLCVIERTAIRQIDSEGNVRTIIGSPDKGYEDGLFSESRLEDAYTAFLNQENLMYFIEQKGTLRLADFKIRNVSTLMKSSSIIEDGHISNVSISNPYWITAGETEDILYIVSRQFKNPSVKKINLTSGYISTLAGGVLGKGDLDGKGTLATFSVPDALVFDKFSNSLFLADRSLNSIRQITLEGEVKTLPILGLRQPIGIAVNSKGHLFVAENSGHCITKIIICPYNSSWNDLKKECECKPSFEYDSNKNECQLCSPGSIKLSFGNQKCSECPEHMESNSNKTKCLNCPAGKQRLSGDIMNGCQNCPIGYFKKEEGNQGCLACPVSTFSSDDFQECVACPAGNYLAAVGDCRRCGVGQQPNYNRTSCIDCPPGTYKPSDSMNTCLKCPIGAVCSTTSLVCGPGYYMQEGRSVCRPCDVGYAKESIGNENTCMKCEVGQQSSMDKSKCETCSPGKYRSSTSPYPYCIDCPPNVLQCSATGFQCLNDYTMTSGKDACIQKISMDDESDYDIDDLFITESDITTNRRKSGSSPTTKYNNEQSSTALTTILMAITIPLTILIAAMLYACYKFRKWWIRNELLFFGRTGSHISMLGTVYKEKLGIINNDQDALTKRCSFMGLEYSEDFSSAIFAPRQQEIGKEQTELAPTVIHNPIETVIKEENIETVQTITAIIPTDIISTNK